MRWTRETHRSVVAMARQIIRDGAEIVYPGMRPADVARLDSVGAVNFAQEFRTVVQKPFRNEYLDLKSKDFIPPSNMGVRMMDDQWAARMISVVGEGKWGPSTGITDSPDVRISGQPFGGVVGTMFATASWDHFDVLRAAQGEINIPTETLEATRHVIETGIDTALAVGVSGLGLNGFVNNPNVSVVPLATGHWDTLTFDQIVADMVAYIYTIRARTGFVEASRPDTMILPPGIFGLLVGKISTYTGINALKVFRDTMAEHGITAVEEWSKLTTAGVGGVNRGIIYRRNPDSVQAIVPTPFYQIAPQLREWNIRVPSMARCGGTVFIKPLTAAYFDNSHS